MEGPCSARRWLRTLGVMRDIDRELGAVENAMTAEDATIGTEVKSDLWHIFLRIVLWSVIAAVVFIVLRAFWH